MSLFGKSSVSSLEDRVEEYRRDQRELLDRVERLERKRDGDEADRALLWEKVQTALNRLANRVRQSRGDAQLELQDDASQPPADDNSLIAAARRRRAERR